MSFHVCYVVSTYFLLYVGQIWTDFNKNYSHDREETLKETVQKVPLYLKYVLALP